MKIKHRKVSFLALTLTGALSLVSFEEIYAVDKAEKGGIDDAKIVITGTDFTKGSGKKEEKFDNKPEASKADEKSKSEEAESRSKKHEEQKLTVVKNEGGFVTLRASDGTRTTIDTHVGKITSEDPATVVATIETLKEQHVPIEGLSAKVTIPSSVLEKDPNLSGYLIGQGFHKVSDEFYVKYLNGQKIEDIVVRLPLRKDVTEKEMTQFKFEMKNVPAEMTKGMPGTLSSNSFSILRGEVTMVMTVIEPMSKAWENGKVLENQPRGNRPYHFEKSRHGHMLWSDDGKAFMMDANEGVKVLKDLEKKGQKLPSIYNITMPAGSEAEAFGKAYGLRAIPFSEGSKASFAISPEVMNRIVVEQPHIPAHAIAVLSYPDALSYNAMKAYAEGKWGI